MQRNPHTGRLVDLLRSARERFWLAPVDFGRPGDGERTPLRWQLSRRAVIASLVVALLSCAAAVAWVLAAAPRTVATGQATVGAGSLTGGARAPTTGESAVRPGGSLKSPPHPSTVSPSSSATRGEQLVVDVIGRVRRPGVYRLAPGARVDDAIKAAGGLAPGTSADSVNLARRVSDGEQIAVAVPAAPGGTGWSGSSSGAAAAAVPGSVPGRTAGTGPAVAGQPLDLNTATAGQLDALPGVGPALAQRIIDFRDSHGPFSSVDDLKSVSGIGDAKFAQLRTRVTVG